MNGCLKWMHFMTRKQQLCQMNSPKSRRFHVAELLLVH